MSIRLIAFDLDDTLLAADKSCPAENMTALKRAAARGIRLVPATGRNFGSMPEEIRGLPFIRYGVTINGADVYDREEDVHIYEAPLSAEDAERVFDFLAGLSVTFDCFIGGRAWVERSFYDSWPRIIDREPVRRMLMGNRTPVDGFRAFVRASALPVQKVTATFADQKTRLAAMEEIKKRFPGLLITTSLYDNLEVNAPGADKGSGLAALCRHLGIPLSDVMAAGDGDNDAAMLRTAGFGAAMSNASPAARRAARFVTLRDNNNAGFAEAVYACCPELRQP